MAEKKISELNTLAQQLQNSDYVPVIHSGVTYKFAPYNYLVKNSGDETIADIKTFSSSPLIPTATTSTQAVNYGQVVKNTGDETIAGIKTFNASPIVPTPTTNMQTATKQYVDTVPVVSGGSASAVQTHIDVRRDTAANWASANPVLHQGEEGFETDTGRRKIGDGVMAWNSIGYSIGSLVYKEVSVVISSTAGDATTVAHGLNASKMVFVDGYVNVAGTRFPANVSSIGASYFDILWNSANIIIYTKTSGSSDVLGKTAYLTIAYKL